MAMTSIGWADQNCQAKLGAGDAGRPLEDGENCYDLLYT
jgi:hypothetical protein